MDGHSVPAFSRGSSAGMELVLAAVFPVYRWAGNWRVFGVGANVCRGNFASALARTFGRLLSIQCGVWNFARLSLQLSRESCKFRCSGVALATGDCGISIGPVLLSAIYDSA